MNLPLLFTASKDPNSGALKIVFSQFLEIQEEEEDRDSDDSGDREVKREEVKKEISMKEFYREYRKLKRMQNSVKNNYIQPTTTSAVAIPNKPPPNIS